MGFVIVDKKIMEWEWYKDVYTYKLFTHALWKANWKGGNFKGVEVPRGSFVTSLSKLAEESGLTIQQTRTALKHLNLTGELTDKSYSKFRIVTVNNYDMYQSPNSLSNNQLTSNQQATNKQLTTIEQYNNNNNDNNIESSPPAQPPTTKGKKKSSILSHDEIDKVLTERNLSEGVKRMLHEWCEYKREKNQAYRQHGLNSAIKTITGLADKYGEDAVDEAMNRCMANNYDGLILEKFIDQKGGNTNGSSKRDTSGAGDGGDRKEPVYGSYEWYRSVGYKES